MSAVKGAILSLLADAYQRRDKVGLVSFRGEGAQLLLPPTTSVELAAPRLKELPTGGRTPLGAGLEESAAAAWESTPLKLRHATNSVYAFCFEKKKTLPHFPALYTQHS